MNQKISIITASYNYAHFIGETIESVLGQTYTNWELIIVDDGSKDNSIEVIQKYCEQNERIKLFTHEGNINRGLPETIKFALTKCEGDWVAFLESDDIFIPTSLEEKVKIAQHYPDISIIFSDIDMLGDEQIIAKNDIFLKDVRKVLDKLKYPCDISEIMVKNNLISTFSVVMVKKSEIEKCDFNSPMPACLDWYLWIQLSPGGVYYIDKKLSQWRMHNTSYINETEELTTEFRLGILKFLVKRNKWLYLRYFRYFRRRFIRMHLFSQIHISIMGKTVYEKKKKA